MTKPTKRPDERQATLILARKLGATDADIAAIDEDIDGYLAMKSSVEVACRIALNTYMQRSRQPREKPMPPTPINAEGTFYGTPDDRDAALAAMLQRINGAQKSMRLIGYAFSHPDLLPALAAACARGVDFRACLDLSQSMGHSEVIPLHGFLLQVGADKVRIGEDALRQIIHAKCLTVDDRWVLEGSLNWTLPAFREINTLLILDCPVLAQAINAQFNALWAYLGQHPVYQAAKAA